MYGISTCKLRNRVSYAVLFVGVRIVGAVVVAVCNINYRRGLKSVGLNEYIDIFSVLAILFYTVLLF